MPGVHVAIAQEWLKKCDEKSHQLAWREDARMFLWAWALVITCSLSDVERQNAGNKAYNEKAGGYAMCHQVSANGLCCNARHLLIKRAVQRDEHEKDLRNLANTDIVSASTARKASQESKPMPRQPTFKVPSALEFYKRQFLTEQAAIGKPCRIASKEFWQEFRSAWDNLSEERRRNFVMQQRSGKYYRVHDARLLRILRNFQPPLPVLLLKLHQQLHSIERLC